MLDGTDGFVLRGVDADDQSGRAVACAGDVNGDGIDDLIIGARSGDAAGVFNAGESFVVFGAQTLGAGGVFELSALDGTNGFVLEGVAESDSSGYAVAAAGDVNGDGIDDLLVGAVGADPNGDSSGETYLIFGAANLGASGVFALASLDGTNGFVLRGIAANDLSGNAVASAGDLNDDGAVDIVIGGARSNPDGSTHTGAAYVVFGGAGVGAGGVIELGALDGTNGFVLEGIDVGDFAGRDVSTAGDMNGDGVTDLLVSAHRADVGGNATGESYVLFGSPGIGAGGVLDLDTLDGTNGFVLIGVDAGDTSGVSASTAGDVNGDGFDDIVIGASYADPNGSASGESSVVFGAEDVGASGLLALEFLDGTDGYQCNGTASLAQSGRAVSLAGDVNGDGVDDIVLGAPFASPNGATFAGAASVVFGGAAVGATGAVELGALDGTDGFTVHGVEPNDFTGYAVSGAGDVNGDGVDDVLIGAYSANPNGNASGASYVIFGRSNGAPCPGDANDDGTVNIDDLNTVLFGWGTAGPEGDLNGDGAVDLTDLNAVLGAWGSSCD